MTIRKEVIGDATLYCGSMEDVLPTLGKVDTVVMDPPYGISFSTNRGFSSWDRKQIESDQSVAARDIALLLCQHRGSAVLRHSIVTWDAGRHPNEKPVSLLFDLVPQTIVDPFMGSSPA
jgi:tRNA G10  N-methylase Trm11